MLHMRGLLCYKGKHERVVVLQYERVIVFQHERVIVLQG